MGLFDTLKLVVGALDQSSIPHMVAGSIGSAHYGEARSTQDIDIVIDPDAAGMADLLVLLRSAGLYVGDGLAALADRSQFNVIDTATGWKVDLIIRKDRPFSRSEFERRRETVIGGVPVYVLSAEDSILSKLEWGSASASERQFSDAAAIVAVRGDELDWAYLVHWAAVLGVADQLRELRAVDET